jgi:hypothetical protein
MKITIIKQPKIINTPNQPIVPSDIYPDGLRPPGARQPLVEYSILGKMLAGLNGYSGYS